MSRLVLETDTGIIRNNARCIRTLLPPSVKMLCVVKADAYGHGALKTSEALLRSGLADAFAVATASEGAALREGGISDAEIIVLGPICEPADADSALRYGLSQAVSSAEDVLLLKNAARRSGKSASAQLKVDTGMSRTGVLGRSELDTVLDAFKNAPEVQMRGMFTHFCAADTDPEFTREQKRRFDAARETVFKAGFTPVCHAAASSALLKAGYGYDMVRAGIALYGTGVPELAGKLKAAQRLISRPAAFRRIQAGDTVGYGRTFTAARETLVMTVPCGYGDGYPRILGGRADVIVAGQRVPIIGRVCMDMLMADVTDIPAVTRHSTVTLMGSDGPETITPDELAEKAQTIPYEIMLGFSTRVERIWKDSGLK
ncbi:MAG: alanine racemase [Clostridia bacterium]|nr:alanine racemase [Clostridia bacterium]